MKIRFATLKDFDLLIEGLEDIRKHEGYKYIHAKEKDKLDYRKAIKNKNIKIIEVNGKKAGFLYFKLNFKLMYIDEKFLWVQRIYVRKEFRGKGFSRILYNNAIKIARKNGLGKIFCDVYAVNKKSIKVHKKIGFSPIYTIYQKKL